MEKDYYSILGVSKSASTDEINKAFRDLAKKWHPDRFVGKPEEERQAAEEKFKEISEAHEVLSDDEKRREYDNPGFGGFGDFGGFGGFNPFDMFMGGGRHQQRQQYAEPGEDAYVKVNVSLEDLYNEDSIKVNYYKNFRCSTCHGEGGKTHACSHCGGTGMIQQSSHHGNAVYIQQSPCPHCHGTGRVVDSKCGDCHGTGFKKQLETFELSLDEISFGKNAQYGIGGRGHQSKNERGNDGNLIVDVKFDYNTDKYRFVDGNLYQIVDVPYYDALLGVNKEITLPNYKKISIKIDSCTKNGAMIKSSGDGPKGKDFYMVVNITYPKSLSKDEKHYLEKIKELKK